MGVIVGSVNYKLETQRKRAFLQYSSDSRIPPADDADPLTITTLGEHQLIGLPIMHCGRREIQIFVYNHLPFSV